MNNTLALLSSRCSIARTNIARPSINKKMAGFSLVELMLVLVMVGLLASMAIPSYSSFTMKQRRTDAQNLLLINANRLARCLTFSGVYDSNCKLLEESKDGHYSGVVFFFPDTGSWKMYVEPVADGNQAEDTECTMIILDSFGAKSSRNSDGENPATNDPCW